jgi:hypothetical protein
VLAFNSSDFVERMNSIDGIILIGRWHEYDDVVLMIKSGISKDIQAKE